MPAIRVVLWSWCLLALGSGPAGAAPQIVVAADGSGAFTTIDAALASLPPGRGERVVVLVKNGVYTEKVRLDRHRVTLRGESRDGVRLQFHAPRSEYDKRYDRRGPGVLNVFGEDVIVQQMTIENTQTTDGHAFAIYGQPQRFILDDCDVLGVGGDTLSLWNTTYGMYYHRNCRMTGGVDFVCPRGWCFIRDSQFESASTSAALWHDGHMNHDMKFVVRNSRFDGPENFWLGRNHYPAQFYLLDCQFSSRMADKPIGVVTDVSQLPESQQRLYERKYFHNCHREGGDFPWHADNLTGADGAPAPADITAAWTFDGKWDPESAAPPTVVAVEVDDDEVHAYFSEDVAGARQACVVRDDGSIAALTGGDGTRRLEFRGGNAAATPRRLDLRGDDLYGTVATLDHRAVRGGELPAATPRRVTTILVIGDSTVAANPPGNPSQGWGAMLGQFFDDRVKVVNYARNGRSSKSFRDEGLWDEARLVPADIVFIQFGHNDNANKGPERATDPAPGGSFRANMAQYVEDVRAMGATPILVSPVARRKYDDTGQIGSSEGNWAYAEATLAVAESSGCAVVDLHRIARELYERLGEQSSHWLQIEEDRTHFTVAGARCVAALLVGAAQRVVPPLQPLVLQDELWRH